MGASRKSGMVRGIIVEIWDKLGDPRRGPGRIRGYSRRSVTGRGTLGKVQDGSGTLGEVQDESGDPPGGPGRVRGLSRRSRTGWVTLPKVWDGSGDSRKGPGGVG